MHPSCTFHPHPSYSPMADVKSPLNVKREPLSTGNEYYHLGTDIILALLLLICCCETFGSRLVSRKNMSELEMRSSSPRADISSFANVLFSTVNSNKFGYARNLANFGTESPKNVENVRPRSSSRYIK